MDLRKDKKFRTLVWQIFNVCAVFVASHLSGIEGENAMFATMVALPFLNMATKYINTKYFGDLGVTTQQGDSSDNQSTENPTHDAI